ncbi:hypothetical protein QZM51_06350 [Burkholderia orbicola]|nr:hypothetical protein [Burkholderia orbicola]MDN7578780.1 hypothetical protein [Burkholderia orbicola]MDN7578807.1 hypothetical protein [Burkholderia orbicola]
MPADHVQQAVDEATRRIGERAAAARDDAELGSKVSFGGSTRIRSPNGGTAARIVGHHVHMPACSSIVCDIATDCAHDAPFVVERGLAVGRRIQHPSQSSTSKQLMVHAGIRHKFRSSEADKPATGDRHRAALARSPAIYSTADGV